MALTATEKFQFKEFVKVAKAVRSDLAFLLDTVGEKVSLDWSEESLVRLEAIYWGLQNGSELLDSIGGMRLLEHLLGQYLGESIIHNTGAGWLQCDDKNKFHGQPCIDGFGNHKWDRIYPVAIAAALARIAVNQPEFPGARTKTILAGQFRKAMRLWEKRGQSVG